MRAPRAAAGGRARAPAALTPRARRSYQNTLRGVEEGKRKYAEAGVPFDRPADFFAEMVKSDAHMEKVRRRAGRLAP